MASQGWDDLPADIQDCIRHILELGDPRCSSALKGAHLVSRDWHLWATKATTVLQPAVPRLHDDRNMLSNWLKTSASAFPNVRELILHPHLRVQDFHLTLLEGFPRLVCLDLSDCELITEKGATMLGQLSRLTKLNVDRIIRSSWRLSCANWIEDLTGLTDLSLRYWNIDDEGAQHLATLTKLVSLDLWNCGMPGKIGDSGAKILGTLSSLTCLKMGSVMANTGLRHLAGLASLRWLALDFIDATDEGLGHLASLPWLTHLHLGRCFDATEVGLGKLAGNLSSLTALELPHWRLTVVPVTDSILQNLLACSTLRHLDMLSWELTDNDMRSVAELSALRSLRLGCVTDATLKVLGDCPFLINISSRKASVTDEDVNMLSTFPSLISLDCCYRDRTEADIVGLDALSSFTKLVLWGPLNNVTDTGVRIIAMITSLETLCLPGDHITDDGMRSVAKLASLTYLDLGSGSSEVTDSGLLCLTSLVSLTHLELPGCKITDSGIQCLTSLVSLTHLGLLECHGVTGAVASSLSALTALTTLEVGFSLFD